MSLRSSPEGVAEIEPTFHLNEEQPWAGCSKPGRDNPGFFAECDSRYESLKSKLRLIHFAYNFMPLIG